ncbi:hypothetical protein [Actinocrispum sp. NPDC049592]|uniref:hypothetical protein n=1 Tax=Actinocrispum sp. NPDC049592 TaxID=3154835 RepID=UPI003437B356
MNREYPITANPAQNRWRTSFDAPGRRAEQGGRFSAYLPDNLLTRSPTMSAELAQRAFDVEGAVRALSAPSPVATWLEGLARLGDGSGGHRRPHRRPTEPCCPTTNTTACGTGSAATTGTQSARTSCRPHPMASTRWDTREFSPGRPVAAAPAR